MNASPGATLPGGLLYTPILQYSGFKFTVSTVTVSLEPSGLGVVEALNVKLINAKNQLQVKLKHQFP